VVRFTYLCFIGLIGLAVLLGAAAPWLLAALVGEEFRPAGPIIIYIAIGHAFTGMYYLVANYIFLAGRTANLALVSLTTGLFNAAASYWLVLQNGVAGAAQAFMLAQLFLFLGTWYFAQRAHPMPWRAILAPSRP
jgi:O-antigen/teichoic acid export membrane protein